MLGDSTLPLYIATKQVNESRFAPLHEVYTQARVSSAHSDAHEAHSNAIAGPPCISHVHEVHHTECIPEFSGIWPGDHSNAAV